MEFDRDRLKKLAHYVIAKGSGKDGFGATKLYKVMWFAEARSHVLRGDSISGATYIRREHGPVPELGMQIRNELAQEGLISQKLVDRGNYKEWSFVNRANPDTSFMTKEQRQDVDYWFRHIDEDHTAASISDESHNYAWEIAEMGEPLPFFALLSERVREPSDSELEEARKDARDLGII